MTLLAGLTSPAGLSGMRHSRRDSAKERWETRPRRVEVEMRDTLPHSHITDITDISDISDTTDLDVIDLID